MFKCSANVGREDQTGAYLTPTEKEVWKDVKTFWSDWEDYNLDAPTMIPQGGATRVRSGKIGFLQFYVKRPGD